MASLYKRNGVWWVVYHINGKRFRVSTRTRNKNLAKQKLNDIELKLFKGELGIPEKNTPNTSVSDFFRKFKEYCLNNYAKEHIQSDLSRLENFQNYCARNSIRNLQSITPGVIEDFISTVLNGRRPKTKKNYIALLKTALNYAVKWNIIEINPIANVKPPKIVKTFNFFSKEEIRKLIAEAKEPLKSAIIILVNTGLRRAELFHLRWRDIDLEAERLRVWPYEGFTPKGKQPRSIPLNKDVIRVLKKLQESSHNSEYVLRPYKSLHTLRWKLSVLLKELGMQGTLHDLRHTFASHLAMNGTSIPIIKELLGHTDISTTMIYAHLSPEIYKPEVNKLDFQ